MLFIVSPAKKMNSVDNAFEHQGPPKLVHRTFHILEALSSLSLEEAQAVWKCSDALAELNYDRVQHMDLMSALTSAVFSYEGIQYQHLAPHVMTEEQLQYLQNHLRILSGFYGVLRPFDGVTPYRLEMQAKLPVGTSDNLYQFWGSDLFDALREETDVIVNLASAEYAKAVVPSLREWNRSCDNAHEVELVTCLFGTLKDGKLVQRSTEAKAARGSFVRWCAEHQVKDPAEFVNFDVMGYTYNQELSSCSKDGCEKTLAFVR